MQRPGAGLEGCQPHGLHSALFFSCSAAGQLMGLFSCFGLSACQTTETKQKEKSCKGLAGVRGRGERSRPGKGMRKEDRGIPELLLLLTPGRSWAHTLEPPEAVLPKGRWGCVKWGQGWRLSIT